jgi:hypothetical protein
MRKILITGALALSAVVPLALAASNTSAATPVAEDQSIIFLWKGPVRDGREGSDVSNILARYLAYTEVHYPDSPVRVFSSRSRSSSFLYWFREHDDLASRQQLERTLGADEGWQALEREWGEHFGVEEEESIVYLFPIGGAARDDGSKFYRWLRVTRSPAMQVPLARAFAKKVVEHLEANYPGLEAPAYSADKSDPAAIYWMIDYESSSTWESIRARLLEDRTYVEMFREAEDLFFEEATSDFLVHF